MEPWRDELYHHGILGQRWGIRRFQNDDGSLTAAGRERYGVGDDDGNSQQYQDMRPDDSYNAELSRISPNAQYESMMNDAYMQRQIEEQKRRTRNIIIGVGAAIAVTAGGIVIAKKFREAKEERDALAGALKELGDKAATKDDLKDYAKTGDLKDFLKKDAIKDMAKKGDLKDYAKTGDLKDFLKKDAIKDMAKKSDLSGFMKTSDADSKYASKSALDAIKTAAGKAKSSAPKARRTLGGSEAAKRLFTSQTVKPSSAFERQKARKLNKISKGIMGKARKAYLSDISKVMKDSDASSAKRIAAVKAADVRLKKVRDSVRTMF